MPDTPVKIILLNGPPGCGKDTAAKAIEGAGLECQQASFANQLKAKVHHMLGLPYGAWEMEQKYGHQWKDTPNPDFYGHTPRETYIWFSEVVCKPRFGKQYFGSLLRVYLEYERAHWGQVRWAISDSGFAEEALVLADAFGKENMLLCKITREGHTFEGDSRGYLDLYGITTFHLINHGPQADFEAAAIRMAKAWFLHGR